MPADLPTPAQLTEWRARLRAYRDADDATPEAIEALAWWQDHGPSVAEALLDALDAAASPPDLERTKWARPAEEAPARDRLCEAAHVVMRTALHMDFIATYEDRGPVTCVAVPLEAWRELGMALPLPVRK